MSRIGSKSRIVKGAAAAHARAQIVNLDVRALKR